jgi:predicted RNase H-like nuclease (RuvC/YqgF family)
MLDYGSHVPLSLPLEFSKFSGKVLDTRTKEQKSAHFKRYDDAAALRGEAVKKEKEELDVCTDRFARSFKLQRQRMVTTQDMSRTGFKDHWQVKKETQERMLTKQLMELKRAVEHLERDLAEAQREADDELKRIKNNERILNAVPVLGKPAATQRRF